MKPFLVSHPEHGRMMVLAFTTDKPPRVIVAGEEVAVIDITDLTVVTPGSDWPDPWPEYDRENRAWRNSSAALKRDLESRRS